ncbi:MAG: GNAT family N-acetyltransferase, partial [Spirochaetota bacterium]
PEYQRQGWGGMLLGGIINTADERGLGIYLETQSEKNVGIYRRYGFTVADEFILPEINIKCWAMKR